MSEPSNNAPAWYCVRTQTKREHLAAEHLRGIEGVEVFCPRLRYRKATARGKIWWVEPFFPGYVLAKFDLDTMDRTITFSHGVRGLVRFGSIVPTIPESLIHSLQRDIREHSSHETDTLETAPIIEIGDEVHFAHGPLQGMNGIIVSIAPAVERVKVLLEFLGQPNTVDVDLFSLLLPRRPLPRMNKS